LWKREFLAAEAVVHRSDYFDLHRLNSSSRVMIIHR
jgi:hypothetical protein